MTQSPFALRSLVRPSVVRTIAVVAAFLLVPVIASPAVATPFPAGPATADTPSGISLDPRTLAVMRQQEALEPAVALLYRDVLKSPDSGFAGIAYEDGGISLYWKGALSSSMRDAVAAARKLGPVRVRPAQHSRAELRAQAARIHAASEGGDIQEILTRHDGSGMDILRMPPSLVELVRAKAAKDHRVYRAADEVLSSVNPDVPVTVRTADSAAGLDACAAACNRLDDTSPWNGGTRLIIRNTPTGTLSCTSGFAVRNSSGTTFVLTAAHCATREQAYDAQGEHIGGVHREDWRTDVLLINARGNPRIFDGTDSTSFSKAVQIYGYPVANQLLCQSGATSGTVCGLRTVTGVYSFRLCDSDGDCFSVQDMNKAVQVNGQIAIRGGDSGGPVFALHGSGVQAKGIANGHDSAARIGMYFQDFATINNVFGVYPVTV